MRCCTLSLGALFVIAFIMAHVPVGPDVTEAEAVAMQNQSRKARSSSGNRGQGERSSQRSARERSNARKERTRSRDSKRSEGEAARSSRRQASSQSARSSGQRSSSSSSRSSARGRTQPGRSTGASRTGPPAKSPAPRPRPNVRYKVLEPRAPRYRQFHLRVHIQRLVSRVREPVIIRTREEQLIAYEVAQEFVMDNLPRSHRVSFPRYRPDSRRVAVEYLGRGTYLVAGEVTTRSRSGRQSRRAFEVIIEEGRRGWDLVEFYLER